MAAGMSAAGMSAAAALHVARSIRRQPLGHSRRQPLGHSRRQPLGHSRRQPLGHSRRQPLGHSRRQPLGHSRRQPLGHSRRQPLGQFSAPIDQTFRSAPGSAPIDRTFRSAPGFVTPEYRGSNSFANRDINRQLDHRNLVTGSVRGVNASMLRNDAWAKNPSRNGTAREMSKASFQGKFADKHWDKDWNKHWNNWNGNWHWRHHHPFIAAGWYGSLFWPWAYWDFVDYTFWPYAYDVFWPYAYDDLYEGVFGPYAYEEPAYADVRPASRTDERFITTAVFCNAQAPALTDWPIQQIAQTVQPDEAQQSALNGLKDATAKAVSVLQAACPDELPSTPTGRLEAMSKRIGTMLLAVSIVQPPLQRFYDSLNDEQKARFNVVGPEALVARASSGGDGSPDLSQICGVELLKAKVPTERIAQALKPTDVQRTALDALSDATKKSADFLKANCSVDQTLTPPARVAAMEHRLNAMLEAIKIVQPALENFYGLLTDEQKARFNELGLSQGSMVLSGSIRDAGPSAVARSRPPLYTDDPDYAPVLHFQLGR